MSFPPESGTTIDGRFVVKRQIGGGGMGVVLLAEHLGLKRLVAVKLLRPEFLKSPTVVHRFLREARAVATLKSEHVVDVLDAGTFSTRIPYFVMEHLQGIDLASLVARRGPLGIDDVVHYALQSLEAIAEAHRRGVVHRDLKPSNLFLTTREDDSALVKVLDFGVSKLIDWGVTSDGMVTRQGTLLGSPRYMSPEQIQDAGDVDGRSDIWSIGSCIHELLSETPPFDADSIGLVIRAICTQPYELPKRDDLPPELAEILVRCLQKDRRNRFANVEALARAFQPLAHTPAARVSIDRILRRGSGPPPGFSDERIAFPSITPITADTLYRLFSKRGRKRLATAGLVLAGSLAGAYLLVARSGSSDAPSPVAVAGPRVAPPAPPPVPAAVPVPRPVVTARPAPRVAATPPPQGASEVRKTVATTSQPRVGSPAPQPKSLTIVDLPPPPERKVRPIDTANPFVK